jgi:hypothetical protein
MVSKFKEALHILKGAADDEDVTLSVCAMGPVAEGDELTWMRVWVWQQDGERRAVSSGLSGIHLGGHKASPMEQIPFTHDKGWMIQTKLEPGSEQFSVGKPATAMALALVTRGESRDVQHWTQAVLIAGDERGHDEHEHGHEDHQH